MSTLIQALHPFSAYHDLARSSGVSAHPQRVIDPITPPALKDARGKPRSTHSSSSKTRLMPHVQTPPPAHGAPRVTKRKRRGTYRLRAENNALVTLDMLDPARRGLYVHYEIEEDVQRQYADLYRMVVTTPQSSPLVFSARTSSSRGSRRVDAGKKENRTRSPNPGTWASEVVAGPFDLDSNVWEEVHLDNGGMPLPLALGSSLPHLPAHDIDAGMGLIVEKDGESGRSWSPSSGRCRQHRPPPLDLARGSNKRRQRQSVASGHPFACNSQSLSIRQSAFDNWDDDDEPMPLHSTASSSLLSPLPMLSPGAFKARKGRGSKHSPSASRFEPQQPWKENVDLALALDELLFSCGEQPSTMSWYHQPSPITPRRSADLESASSSAAGVLCQRQRVLRTRSRRLSDSETRLMASAFPMPPTRPPPAPARPPRTDDMGVELIASLGSHPDLWSPISPDVSTPRTPLFRSTELASPLRLESPLAHKGRSRRPAEWVPHLQGDHSFLQALSRGHDPVHGKYSPISPPASLRSESSFGSTSSTRSLPRRSALPDAWKSCARI